MNSGTIWGRFVEKTRGIKSGATAPVRVGCGLPCVVVEEGVWLLGPGADSLYTVQHPPPQASQNFPCGNVPSGSVGIHILPSSHTSTLAIPHTFTPPPLPHTFPPPSPTPLLPPPPHLSKRSLHTFPSLPFTFPHTPSLHTFPALPPPFQRSPHPFPPPFLTFLTSSLISKSALTFAKFSFTFPPSLTYTPPLHMSTFPLTCPPPSYLSSPYIPVYLSLTYPPPPSYVHFPLTCLHLTFLSPLSCPPSLHLSNSPCLFSFPHLPTHPPPHRQLNLTCLLFYYLST